MRVKRVWEQWQGVFPLKRQHSQPSTMPIHWYRDQVNPLMRMQRRLEPATNQRPSVLLTGSVAGVNGMKSAIKNAEIPNSPSIANTSNPICA